MTIQISVIDLSLVLTFLELICDILGSELTPYHLS